MEINKQLFEDILLGKLKGTFVLRDGSKYGTFNLHRNAHKRKSFDYPYVLYIGNYTFGYYNANGKNGVYLNKYDIIDFIPDTDMKDFTPETNMKENELTIEIPDGKIVDWDESKKQNKVVLKDKQLTYEEICEKLFQPNGGYHICGNGEIVSSFCADLFLSNTINATSKHQLECILAKNKLANVAKYLNDGWKPNFSDMLRVFVLYNENDTLKVDDENSLYARSMGHIIFKLPKLAKQAIEILGEETVKLALEPLGI